MLFRSIDLDHGNVAIALNDLTGFNARCDALYLTTDADESPPHQGDELQRMRRQLANVICHDDPAQYDLIVAGGGFAGICAAIAALRSGARVALLHDRPVLGGCNSSEIRVSAGGITHTGPYPKLGNVVQEIAPVFGGNGTYATDVYEDARKQNVFRLHPPEQYCLALNERVIAVEAQDNRIAAVITRHVRTGAEKRYRGKLFADCTGDAAIARMMGAETVMGREPREKFNESLAPTKADRQVMGMSVQWYSSPADQPAPFPDIDWGIEFTEDKAYYVRGGNWEWETGQYRNQALETEYIRDYGLMVTYANWSFIKNHSTHSHQWSHEKLAWVSPLGGKRESCRVVGDYMLTQNDIENFVSHDDGTACITWNIDLHFPDPENAEKFQEPFRSCAYHRGIAKPYPVPYRCLYARDVDNLFLGGRHISMSHVAFASARVMRVLGMLGEVIGMAAAICATHQCLPRDVATTHLRELKAMMAEGVKSPLYHLGGGNCEGEMYHFKDLGKVIISPISDGKIHDPQIDQRIRKLGSQIGRAHV